MAQLMRRQPNSGLFPHLLDYIPNPRRCQASNLPRRISQLFEPVLLQWGEVWLVLLEPHHLPQRFATGVAAPFALLESLHVAHRGRTPRSGGRRRTCSPAGCARPRPPFSRRPAWPHARGWSPGAPLNRWRLLASGRKRLRFWRRTPPVGWQTPRCGALPGCTIAL